MNTYPKSRFSSGTDPKSLLSYNQLSLYVIYTTTPPFYRHHNPFSFTFSSSSVIEAIQFHTRTPDGKRIRSSKVLGSPFSPDVRQVLLCGNGPNDTLVGFNGRCNKRRLTALGLQMREVALFRFIFLNYLQFSLCIPPFISFVSPYTCSDHVSKDSVFVQLDAFVCGTRQLRLTQTRQSARKCQNCEACPTAGRCLRRWGQWWW